MAALRPQPAALLLLVAAVLLRVVASWWQPLVWDSANYRSVASTLLAGGWLYRDTPGQFPYAPPWTAVEVAARLAEVATNLPYPWLIRLPIIAADVVIVMLLRALGGRRAALGYVLALTPPLVTVVVGQFDAVAVALVLLCAYRIARRGVDWRAGLLLGLAIAVKPLPVLLLPLLVLRCSNWSARWRVAMAAALPPALLLAPFLAVEPEAVIRQVVQYSGEPQQGLGRMLALTGVSFPLAASIGKALFGLGYLALLTIVARRGPLPGGQGWLREAGLVWALFYVCYPGIASHYLLWLLPCLLVSEAGKARQYDLLAALCIICWWYGADLPALRLLQPLLTTVWAYWCARHLLRSFAARGGQLRSVPPQLAAVRAADPDHAGVAPNMAPSGTQSALMIS